MKILVTGACGLLGTSLLRLMKGKFDIYASDLKGQSVFEKNINYLYMDVTSRKQIRKVVNKIKPSLIIYLAALTDLEKCENNKKFAKKINVDSTANVVSICKKKNIKFLFISTDNVFDGVKGNYSEVDKMNPINYYGKTKVMAEKKVRKLKQYLILRTTFFSWGRGFERWLVNSLRSKKEVNVVDDQYYSPLFVDDFSKIIIKVIRKRLIGTYNVGLSKRISRFDFALVLAKSFNLNKSLIRRVSTTELYDIIKPKSFKIPQDVSLNVSKLKKVGIKIPSLSICLKHMKDTEWIYC